jgi:glycosyltransferase involved in cell wall biosynthesis
MERLKPGWTVVIMCYNEEANVRAVMSGCRSVMRRMGAGGFEILVVDDGSTDGSKAAIEKGLREIPEARAIFHGSNRGIGETLRSGYFGAAHERICAVPGDGQFDPEELLPFARVEVDRFVSFYREENLTYSPFRNALSWLNRMVNRLFLGLDLNDVNWVKVYPTRRLRELDLELHSSLVESEICAKLLLEGTGCIQARSKYLPRKSGASKGASARIIWAAVKELARLYKAVLTFARRRRR